MLFFLPIDFIQSAYIVVTLHKKLQLQEEHR